MWNNSNNQITFTNLHIQRLSSGYTKTSKGTTTTQIWQHHGHTPRLEYTHFYLYAFLDPSDFVKHAYCFLFKNKHFTVPIFQIPIKYNLLLLLPVSCLDKFALSVSTTSASWWVTDPTSSAHSSPASFKAPSHSLTDIYTEGMSPDPQYKLSCTPFIIFQLHNPWEWTP